MSDKWDNDCPGDITIATGENFPDGLAAAALGGKVLLVKTNEIPAATDAALKWNVTNCVAPNINVIGGVNVISSGIFEALMGYTAGTVTRWAGADRYATALEVAGAVETNPCDVVLATGENFPDALAAGVLALQAGAPIVLTTGTSLRADVKAYLATMGGGGGCVTPGIPTVHIVGGTAAVPASIEVEILTMGIATNRLAGANRAETAAAIADVVQLLNGGLSQTYLVNGSSFADALSAGPLAYDTDGVLLPVNADSIPTATAKWHNDACNDIHDSPWDDDRYASAIGGAAVISDAIIAAAGEALVCPPITATATVATADSKSAAWLIGNDTSAFGAGEGVILSGRAGSGADGLASNAWTVNVSEAAVGDPSKVTVLDYDTKILSVEIDIPESGLTEAQFAEIWNGLAPANLLFLATAQGANTWDVGDDFDGSGGPATTAYLDQVVTVTFSEPVDWCDGTDLRDDNFIFSNGATFTLTSADGPGSTVYTLAIDQATSAVDPVVVAGVTKIDLADSDVACSVKNDNYDTSENNADGTNVITVG
jgi:putative cell wall-binding protein